MLQVALTTSLPLSKLVVQEAGTHAKYRRQYHQRQHDAHPYISDEPLVGGIQQLFASVSTEPNWPGSASEILQTTQQVEITGVVFTCQQRLTDPHPERTHCSDPGHCFLLVEILPKRRVVVLPDELIEIQVIGYLERYLRLQTVNHLRSTKINSSFSVYH